jgi:4-hydroxy-3-polyprenylbenzoate decarboxylase
MNLLRYRAECPFTGARVDKNRLIVAIAGGSGAVYGVRALEALRRLGTIETHLIMTRAGAESIAAETSLTVQKVVRLADVAHDAMERRSSPFATASEALGLLVAPCSTETLRAIADEDNTDLVARAAEACLKARRRVVLLLPETPLEITTIQLMAKATRLGAVMLPPVPAFYHRPATLDAIIDQTVGRALDLFDIEAGLVRRWTESDQPSP